MESQETTAKYLIAVSINIFGQESYRRAVQTSKMILAFDETMIISYNCCKPFHHLFGL